MTKLVAEMLARAKALPESDKLTAAIEAIEALGDDAKGNTEEFRTLKEIVETTEAALDSQSEPTTEPTPEPTKKPAAVRLKGIKMIGALYYSPKDGYQKGFPTAEECAEHFEE